MALLSTSSHGKKWLKNFDRTDQVVASLLIDNLMLVGASEFASQINAQLAIIAQQAYTDRQTLALYSEREIKDKRNNIPPFFFSFEKGRAVGKGNQLVKVDLDKQDVGSEGIIAALITKFCKANSNTCISHPGPDSPLDNGHYRKVTFDPHLLYSGNYP